MDFAEALHYESDLRTPSGESISAKVGCKSGASLPFGKDGSDAPTVIPDDSVNKSPDSDSEDLDHEDTEPTMKNASNDTILVVRRVKGTPPENSPCADGKSTGRIISKMDREQHRNADFRITQPFARIIGADWQNPAIYPGSAKPTATLSAFCINEIRGNGHSEDGEEKFLAIGRKRKKDESIFRLEVISKIGGPVVHTRDIRDAFAGGCMCFLTPKVLLYTSWNITTGSPLIRLFDLEKSTLGPSLHTQNFLRLRTTNKFPGGFFQNFKGMSTFILDESEPTSIEMNLSPHIMAWSMEGLVCVWELTCVYVCAKTGRLRYNPSHNRNGPGSNKNGTNIAGRRPGTKSSEAGNLRRLEVFPKDAFEDDFTLSVRNRLLGVTLSKCGTKIICVDRYWRIWIWRWKDNSFKCVGIGDKLKAMNPVKGSISKPDSTFHAAGQGGSNPTAVEEPVSGGDPNNEWSSIPKCDWVVKPKQLNLVYANDSNVLIIGKRVGQMDEEKSRVEGAIEPNGTLWPPTWRDCDWLVSVDLTTEEIVEVQEAWHPVKGPGRFIFALTDREPDSAWEMANKKRGKRGLLLLRERDLCVTADSRTQSSFDRIQVRELQVASYPPIGSADNSRFLELKRKITLMNDAHATNDESKSWNFNLFNNRQRSAIGDKYYTAFSMYCFDGMGNVGMVGAFGT